VFTNSHGHGIIAYNVAGKFIYYGCSLNFPRQNSGYTINYNTSGIIIIGFHIDSNYIIVLQKATVPIVHGYRAF